MFVVYPARDVGFGMVSGGIDHSFSCDKLGPVSLSLLSVPVYPELSSDRSRLKSSPQFRFIIIVGVSAQWYSAGDCAALHKLFFCNLIIGILFSVHEISIHSKDGRRW